MVQERVNKSVTWNNLQIIVADTSALLIRGTDLLRTLPNHSELIIPSVVLGELESKRTSPKIGFLAREWLRLLEDLRVEHDNRLRTGVKVPDKFTSKSISIRVEPNHTNQEILPLQLRNGSKDSTILAVTKSFSVEFPDKRVALISNDVPMRMYCTLELGVPAFEVSSVAIDSVEPFTGRFEITLGINEVSDLLAENGNESVVLYKAVKNLDSSVYRFLVDVVDDSGVYVNSFVKVGDEILRVPRHGNRAKGISPRTLEQRVALSYLLEDAETLPLVSVAGSAGTGKTILALAAGLEGVHKKIYRKVVVFRSLHEMGAGQEMGFLPGTVEEKMGPWSGAVTDAIEVIARNSKKKNQSVSPDDLAVLSRDVEVSPISYLRGRSITDTFMILDEAQNFSRYELLNILSRAGAGTKVVMLFDSNQIDNRFLQSGANAEVWSVVDSLKSSKLFGHISLVRTERSPVAELAASILDK